jgi:glycosyltransferase involved in cell wall biosynthesis
VLNNVESYVHRHEDKTLENFSPDNPYRFNLVHVNADQAHVFANLKGPAYFKQRHNIACWFWELSTFPRSWQSSFNYYQEIWVASGFCQESIAAQAPIPVVKMIQPVLIDTAKVKPDRSRLGLPQDKFIYGFVFDYMSVVERKNPLAIINAFKLAFGDREDVLLLIKTINGNQVPNQVQRLHQAARGSNIQFIDGYLARDEVINLVSSLDSYVSLHRSEGLGISMAQAMYLKKPVIATGYSGNMEFMNHNNSFLVRYQLAELQENLGPYTKGQHWAEPDVEHAAELMRLVFDNQASAQKIAERAAADIKANMTPEVTGSAMKERLLLLL